MPRLCSGAHKGTHASHCGHQPGRKVTLLRIPCLEPQFPTGVFRPECSYDEAEDCCVSRHRALVSGAAQGYMIYNGFFLAFEVTALTVHWHKLSCGLTEFLGCLDATTGRSGPRSGFGPFMAVLAIRITAYRGLHCILLPPKMEISIQGKVIFFSTGLRLSATSALFFG